MIVMAAPHARTQTPEIHIGRIADGKIVEHWGLGDQQEVMKQMELVPAIK
jgi:predicted ester cyclase